jgi:hypothetical protein
MGQILKTRVIPKNKIILHIELPIKEAQNLKNHTKKIHIFSESNFEQEAKIKSKGKNYKIKSIEIPMCFKCKSDSKAREITYQKIETKRKTFYIVTIKKEKTNQSK